jgi:predicted GNAT family N-acyltransferase
MSFEMIDRLTDAQIEELRALYQSEWWTKGRQLDGVRRMLQHSDIIIAFCEPDTKKLVAFTRILTDYAYKALVFDVIVAAPYRGTGLGRRLMDAVVNHPALKAVRHIELYCLPELVPFYQQWGFTTELGKLRFMRRVTKTIA